MRALTRIGWSWQHAAMQLEGSTAVQVSVAGTADDDLQSTNLICAESFRNSYLIGSWIGVSALITGWATLRYSVLTLAVVTLSLAFLSAIHLRSPSRVRRYRSAAHSAQGESSYGIDENGVHWEGDEGRNFTRWSAIRAFTQTPRFWRFDVVDGTCMLIPRANLSPADDAAVATAMQALAHKIKGNNV